MRCHEIHGVRSLAAQPTGLRAFNHVNPGLGRFSDGGLTGDDYSEVFGHSVSSSGTEVKADAASKLGQATFRVEGSEQ